MCGIAGIAAAPDTTLDLEGCMCRMTNTIRHRGPDGFGVRVFRAPDLLSAVALGHRRLAIIDVSDCGLQPMANEDGSVWVVFNGEIYNFLELRSKLQTKGHVFRSHTDTEVLVHLYEEHGVDLVSRLNGMFAFAILDLRTRRLLLARDQLGIKPLYYSADAHSLVFGSEIKAILAVKDSPPKVNWQAVYDYFTYLYVPGPQTTFAGIEQLPPAHTLLYDLERPSVIVERYWQARVLEGVRRAPKRQIEEDLNARLSGATQRELISDVPLGLFLSGGIDSSVLAGLTTQAGTTPRTFTVTFSGPEFRYYSEAALAKETSQFLGTTHHELNINSVNPLEMLALVDYFDQPFGNPTFYLMWLIARKSREHITVALNGAGGDELFAGYPRYRAAQLARLFRRVPESFLNGGRRVLGLLRDNHRTMRLRRAREFLDGLDHDPVREFVRWTYFMTEEDKALLFRSGPGGSWLASDRYIRRLFDESPFEGGNRLLHVDVQSFLIDNLLEYTDKMSMACSMEIRVPLLEADVVEYSLNIPFRWKLGLRGSKLILKDAFRRFLVPSVQRGAKKGFNAPLGMWLNNELDGYFVASQQDKHPLKDVLGEDIGLTWREGILDWRYIDYMRSEHRAGREDLSHELFSTIMFDMWWRKYVARSLPIEHWSTGS